MFNKFRFEVLIQSKSEVDQQFSLGPFHLRGRAGMFYFLSLRLRKFKCFLPFQARCHRHTMGRCWSQRRLAWKEDSAPHSFLLELTCFCFGANLQ